MSGLGIEATRGGNWSNLYARWVLSAGGQPSNGRNCRHAQGIPARGLVGGCL